MTRQERPRCGKWLPRARVNCPLPQEHKGKCRTPKGMRNLYDANNARIRKQVAERYQWMDAYKTEHGCAVCGYNEDPRALDFDHEDPETKVGNVSSLIRYAPWEQVLAEIAKCTILCANHHRVKTFSPERRRPASSSVEASDGPPIA